ncbi:MAG: LysR family transcriptional regulator [Planktomarina sp.]
MKLNLRQLEMLESVAKHGSLTLAAEVLNVTQPAISIQIRKLETEVGLSLVERSGRICHLTEAGEEVVRHAQRISRVVNDLKENLEQYRGVSRGVLRLAVVSTANYFIPEYIAHFRKTHPGVEINLRVANRDSILEMLEANETDLAITGMPPDDSELTARPFKENPVVVIAPPDHALAQKEYLSLAELSKFPFIFREQGSGTRAVMERAFQKHGLDCQESCVLSSNEAVKQAVQAGLGLAVISQQTTDLEVETGRLAILDAEELSVLRHWYVVYRNFRRLPPAALEFRNALLG